MSERINFGKLKEVIEPPNLIQNQIDSFTEFLQMEISPSQRQNVGLQSVFKDVFPIDSYDARCMLDFSSYKLTEPKYSEIECLRDGITYSVGLYVKFSLREEEQMKEEEIYMGELPMITTRGS